MGERIYSIGAAEVAFSDDDELWRCLCTFPSDDEYSGIDAERVASLALLGAAVCLEADGYYEESDQGVTYDGLDWVSLPYDVPEWIRRAIRRVCGCEEGEAADDQA